MIKPRTEQTVESVAGHYDELDRFYRELWGEHLHHGLWRSGRESVTEAVEQLIERLAAELAVSPGDQLCDVGCGYGATARYLARRYDARVTGLTVSAVQQAVAAERAADDPRVRVLLENWEANSLPDASCDGLVSIECISHVPDKRVYFEQVARVLRPGRQAAITAWLGAEQAGRWQENWLLEPICREGRLAGMGTRGEYESLIEAAGLRLVQYADLSRQVRKTWRICAGRVWWGFCTRRDYRQYLWERGRGHAVFLVSVYRILAAYYLGAMQYGLFVIQKPADPRAAAGQDGHRG